MPLHAYRIVLRYLYLGELPRDLVDARSATTEEEVFRGIDKITKQLEVENFWEAVLSVNDRRLARQRYQDEVERAQGQVEAFFQGNVLKHKMVVDTRKVNEIKWPHGNFIFADCLLRADEPGSDEDETEEEPQSNGIPIGPGAKTNTDRGPKRVRRSVIYPVHKAFLIRSPYFETMFSSEFKEARDSEYLHMVTVDCTPEVLEIILTFLYTEKADCPLDLALDLLYTSDMLFLDKLKIKAATTISTLGSATHNVLIDRTHNADAEDGAEVEMEPINVYDVMHAAWDLRVQRLEEFVARYLAYRLEDYIDEPEFAELIQESASRVKNREETDTIELLDDIRYYLSERFRLRFEDAGLEEILDESGEISAEAVESLQQASTAPEPTAATSDVNKPEPDQETKLASEVAALRTTETLTGVVRTLDGELVEDEFESDAMNYQILLGKIDIMLERLKLDA